MLTTLLQSPATLYEALKSHDARFDGQFFVGVTSTRVYCRPVCRVKTPRLGNCLFFGLAAQAEGAGFRPCLRCRPELAPQSHVALRWSTQDASNTLAQQAWQLLHAMPLGELESSADSRIEAVASRLGVSERHLRRIVQESFGITPSQVQQTRRLLAAKALLTDTRLPMPEVALSSGFGSLRRFNAAFMQHYRLPPSKLRKESASDAQSDDATPTNGEIHLQLGFRPPYDAQTLFQFFKQRQLDTIELIALGAHSMPGSASKRLKYQASPPIYHYLRTLQLVAPSSQENSGTARQQNTLRGWLHCSIDLERSQLRVRMSDAFAPALPLVVARLRAAFDLDADPALIDAALQHTLPAKAAQHVQQHPGLRVPGSLDGFEIAVRAILGQQVTVAAGRTFTQRLVQRFGEPIQTPWPELARCFPMPHCIAQAKPSEIGELGIVKQRQTALIALSQAVASGQVDLNSSATPQETMQQLQELPGIGEWTAHYIALRALRWPDAFPAGDVAAHHALGLREIASAAKRKQLAEDMSQAWRPWRGYALLHLWQSLSSNAT